MSENHASTADRKPRPWWVPDPAGSLLGFVLAVLSVTPSLLPRPTVLQGALAALSFALGYLVGSALWAIVRSFLRKRGTTPPWRRSWWLVYAGAWVLAVALVSGLAITWQNEVRRLVSMPPLDGVNISGFLIGFVTLTVMLLLVGKGVHGMFSLFRRRIGTPASALVTTGVVAAILTGLVFAALSGVDRIYFDRNHLPAADPAEPASQFRSAGSGSAVPWDSLGRHGAAFVGGGPSAAKIEEVTGEEAIEPIRVYAGLGSAPTIQERADLVVDELERTGAFERRILVVATTTGSGWLEPQTVDAIEFLHSGDTAIAAMQYAYTPSWVSFVFDPDAPVEAARVLFEAIETRWEQVPEDERPELLTYGLSLGAHGSQAVFEDLADLRARTDGALFVGSPNGSQLWRTLQAGRDAGSPVVLPVLDDGCEVRWMSRVGDELLLSGPWEEPRVLYLQHATDPITWLTPELLWRSPEWLEADQRSPDISPAMRSIPGVTGLHLLVDMLVSEAVPASYGHNFGDVVLTGWQQITHSHLDEQALGRIQAEIETYAPIPRYEE